MAIFPKVIFVATTSIDGFITDKNGVLNFTSSANLIRFKQDTLAIGTVIMGRKTFETLKRPLPKRRNIVYSNQSNIDGVEVTNEPPAKLLRRLSSENIESVAVIGGEETYRLFLNSGLMDELWLTVERVVLGMGKRLFPDDLEFSLRLISSEVLPGTNLVYSKYARIKQKR